MTDHAIKETQAKGSPAGVVFAVGGLWLAVALALLLSGSLETPQGTPPVKILAAAIVPILGFGVWYRTSAALREWVLRLDLPLIVMLQAWRVIGGVFLVLLAFGLLPGMFAWPAGLGDIAVGLSAPFVALALLRRPEAATGPGFLAWNVLGILDFIVAVATGTLASGLLPGLVSGVSTAAMSAWPLGTIPGFIVPLFVILHLMAIFQGRDRAA